MTARDAQWATSDDAARYAALLALLFGGAS